MSPAVADGFKPALLIIDAQEDFCPPNGSLPVPNGRSIIPTLNHLLSLPFPSGLKLATKDHHPADHISFNTSHPTAFPLLQPFVSTITIANPNNPSEEYTSLIWPPHCIVGTKGWEFLVGLDVNKIDRVILKGKDPRVEMYSAFRTPLRNPPLEPDGGELAGILKEEKVTDVIVVGLAGDFCVKASALDCAEIAQELGEAGGGWRCWVVEEGVKSVGEEKGWEETKEELKEKGVKVVSLEFVKERFFP